MGDHPGYDLLVGDNPVYDILVYRGLSWSGLIGLLGTVLTWTQWSVGDNPVYDIIVCRGLSW